MNGSEETEMYSQISSWENLLLATRKASRGKRGKANVAAFEHGLEENLLELPFSDTGRSRCRRQRRLPDNAVPQLLAQESGGALDDRIEVDDRHPPRLAPTEGQQLAGERRGPF